MQIREFEDRDDTDTEAIVHNFLKFAYKKLHIHEPHPRIVFSYDLDTTKQLHRTGSYERHTNTITVYAKNRNLVDILRTVFHELVHVRQEELGMVDPGDSYPGSPVEAMADMVAGKFIKIYGEKHHHIFQ